MLKPSGQGARARRLAGLGAVRGPRRRDLGQDLALGDAAVARLGCRKKRRDDARLGGFKGVLRHLLVAGERERRHGRRCGSERKRAESRHQHQDDDERRSARLGASRLQPRIAKLDDARDALASG